MRTGSEAALSEAISAWDGVLAGSAGTELTAAAEIYAVADLLRGNPSLQTAVQDASRPLARREKLLRDIFSGRVSAQVLDLLVRLAGVKWAETDDLAKSLEALGCQSILHGAQARGALGEVEEELYQARILLKTQRDLRLTLSDGHLRSAARAELAEKIFHGFSPETRALLVRATVTSTQSTLTSAIRRYVRAAAERADHLFASVSSAVLLSAAQKERLKQILQNYYGQTVTVHNYLNPKLLGGMRIHVGDDVIDGTLASRLAAVKEEIKKQS